MEVDMQVAFGREFEVDQRVARELFEHVVEEADARSDFVAPAAVEAEGRPKSSFRA